MNSTKRLQSLPVEAKTFISDMNHVLPLYSEARRLMSEFDVHEVVAPSGQVWGVLDLGVIRDEVIRRAQGPSASHHAVIACLRVVFGMSGEQIVEATSEMISRTSERAASSAMIEANVAMSQVWKAWVSGHLRSRPDETPDVVHPPRRVSTTKQRPSPVHVPVCAPQTKEGRKRVIDGVATGVDEAIEEKVALILKDADDPVDYPILTPYMIRSRLSREVLSSKRDLSLRHGVFGRPLRRHTRVNSVDRVPLTPLSRYMHSEIEKTYSGVNLNLHKFSEEIRQWKWDHQYHGEGT